MGMSTHITGLRDPASKKHQDMVTAAKALNEAGVYELPPKLKEYFNGAYDTSEVLSDEFTGCTIDISSSLEKNNEREMQEDFIVELKSLPEGVTHIRFTNSY